MPITYEDINKLDCNHLEIKDKLISKNVRINDTSDNHFAVYDSFGKRVFWVNDDGVSIRIPSNENVVELDDIFGFPSLKEGLLGVADEDFDFYTEVNLKKVDASYVKVEHLEVGDLAIRQITLPVLNAISIQNNILTTDKITSNEATIQLITNDKLVTHDISSHTINTYKLSAEIFELKNINVSNITTAKLECEEATIKSFQADHAGIAKLECSNILSHNLDIIETANIKLLNCQDGNVESLNCADASFVCLYADKIKLPTAFFGSLEEPLKLNMVDNCILDINNEQGTLYIFNSIVDKTPQNRFQLINLPDGDYQVSTIAHNQFINVSYNLCKINDKTYLFTRFNENTRDLILEIILRPL
jgi:hypothetical protein